MTRAMWRTFVVTLAIVGAARAQWNVPSPPVYVTPDHADHLYKSGEPMRWTVEWKLDGDPPAEGVRYSLKSGGLTEVAAGTLTFEGKVAHFDAKLDEPNSVLATVTWNGGGPGKQAFGGALVDAYDIKPAADEPADFQSFWDGKLAELKTIAPNAQLAAGDAGDASITYAKVTLDNVQGKHVRGQIARPASGEKLPAVLQVQYAGVYPLQKQWVTMPAKAGWLAMNIQAHDIEVDGPPEYYAKLNAGALANYWKIGNADKETSYYLPMYLGIAQAITYLKSRPDWDGKTLVVMGQSQGGQQTIVAAGLCPESVTAALPFVPASCDTNAEGVGRLSGFPFWWNQVDGSNNAAVRETSRYFDPCNFASRVKCPVRAGVALRDDLAPPSSVMAAYNRIGSGDKQILILAKAKHTDEHGEQRPYNDAVWSQWLPAAATGAPLPRVE